MKKCPHCNKEKLTVQQDAISVVPLFEDMTISNLAEDITYLDNSWVECTNCGKTSEDSDELAEIYDNIIW